MNRKSLFAVACLLVSATFVISGCGKKDNAQLLHDATEGDAESQYLIGMAYLNGQMAGTENDALKWIRKAADQGHSAAQNQLGTMYENGKGVKQDKDESWKWYKKSVGQGYSPAEYNMAMSYLASSMPQHAEELFKRAADQGHTDARYQLAIIYSDEKRNKPNYAEAIKLCRQAAENGHTDAQYLLGKMIFAGQGTLRDEIEGLAWMYLGAVQMSPDEKIDLRKAEISAGETARLKAQQRAKELQSQVEANMKQPGKKG